ncbi:MAG: nucleotidyl transferase AbiEii/AbiGii toxin family protein [Gemmatimonadaceae bacterium]|nr:nucleotidyl transferase AbiEii/AbiGii toxin family protein [Gemmatimonadaceae bacterium]
MRFADHRDFSELVNLTADARALLPALVEKDYWVTRVLEAIAPCEAATHCVVFKGGTSLSKAWNVIRRFSEDVDLLITGPNFGEPPTSDGVRKRVFQSLHQKITDMTGMVLPEKSTLGSREEREWYRRRSQYYMNVRYPVPGRPHQALGPAEDVVLVELGYRGGTHPHVQRTVRSMCAEYLDEVRGSALDAFAECEADLAPLSLEVLHPHRTLVEKILALSAGAVGNIPLRPRHYYDVVMVFESVPEAKDFVASEDFTKLVREAAELSNAYYGGNFDVTRLGLKTCSAFAPTADQRREFAALHQSERQMYFGDSQPSFDDLLARLEPLRDLLPD